MMGKGYSTQPTPGTGKVSGSSILADWPRDAKPSVYGRRVYRRRFDFRWRDYSVNFSPVKASPPSTAPYPPANVRPTTPELPPVSRRPPPPTSGPQCWPSYALSEEPWARQETLLGEALGLLFWVCIGVVIGALFVAGMAVYGSIGVCCWVAGK